MRRRVLRGTAALLMVVLLGRPVTTHAQQGGVVLVYDDAVWYQTALEFLQIIEQFRFMLGQAKRLPFDMVARYRALTPPWPLHDLPGSWLYAQPVLGALNVGDPGGGRYRQVVDLLDVPSDVLARMPRELQRRLGTTYATIEMADSVAARGVDQAGTVRANGKLILQTIQNMETDAAAPADSFQTQTAILNKINTASVLGLRIGEQGNQFLLDTLEQLLVENKRKRDSEVKAMNATIYQWRYGQSYGADLFRNTAAAMDGWRPY